MKGRRITGADLERRRLHNGQHNRSYNDKVGLSNSPDKPKFPPLTIGDLPTPAWMNKAQRLIFEEVRDKIISLDIATISDTIAIQMLAVQYTQYIDVTQVIMMEGFQVEVINEKTGVVKNVAHPLLAERGRLYNSVRPLLVEFGLTPNARRAVQARDPKKPEDPEEDEWDSFLNDDDGDSKKWN